MTDSDILRMAQEELADLQSRILLLEAQDTKNQNRITSLEIGMATADGIIEHTKDQELIDCWKPLFVQLMAETGILGIEEV